MQISKNKVVSIHYTLTDNAGNVLDSSDGRDALYYLHGCGNLIIGLEEELEGKSAGAKMQVSIAPEKGYGIKEPGLIQEVPIDAFGGQPVQVGMQFTADTEHGQQMITIAKVDGNTVTVDGNHPLAGTTLNFDVEIMSIREATDEEIAHGHVHGAGGHHH